MKIIPHSSHIGCSVRSPTRLKTDLFIRYLFDSIFQNKSDKTTAFPL